MATAERALIFTFRADASLQIGTGHVMRCLTLADALAQRGAVCHFVCRSHPGNLLKLIAQHGHTVHALPFSDTGVSTHNGIVEPSMQASSYAAWLGVTQEQDANDSRFAHFKLHSHKFSCQPSIDIL